MVCLIWQKSILGLILNLFSSISNLFSVFMAKLFHSFASSLVKNLAMKTENVLEIELNKLRISQEFISAVMRQASTRSNQFLPQRTESLWLESPPMLIFQNYPFERQMVRYLRNKHSLRKLFLVKKYQNFINTLNLWLNL